MKYELVKQGDPTEALGAHSGYRIRLVARRDAETGLYSIGVFYRGSESMPEQAVPVAVAAMETPVAALDHGYELAVDWIDRMDAVDGTSAEREG